MHLHYEDQGPGRVVVLLHGFPLDGSMWEYQRETLGAVYRVIVPDLRGHGKSDVPEGGPSLDAMAAHYVHELNQLEEPREGVYPIDSMADDVIELLDELQLTQPVVIGGLSMGGYVTLSIVARYPERVRALMLMDTKASADAPAAAKARLDLARVVEKQNSAEPVVSSMLPKLFSPWTRENRPELVARVHEQMSRTSPRAIAATLRGLATRTDRTSELPKIRVPALVIAGRDDAIIPVTEAEAMAAAIPNAQLVEVPNAGHLAPLEQSAIVNQVILQFLGSLS
jgi:pimeloyl-ACP methyl ester carboxylesterase